MWFLGVLDHINLNASYEKPTKKIRTDNRRWSFQRKDKFVCASSFFIYGTTESGSHKVQGFETCKSPWLKSIGLRGSFNKNRWTIKYPANVYYLHLIWKKSSASRDYIKQFYGSILLYDRIWCGTLSLATHDFLDHYNYCTGWRLLLLLWNWPGGIFSKTSGTACPLPPFTCGRR